MPLRNCVVKIGAVKTIVHLRAWTKYFLYFLHFSSDVDTYQYGRCSENYTDCEFCDSRCNERHTLIMRANGFSFALVQIFCPVWVICVREVYVILLIICYFRKRRGREDRVFFMGVQKITFVLVICNCMAFRKRLTPSYRLCTTSRSTPFACMLASTDKLI